MSVMKLGIGIACFWNYEKILQYAEMVEDYGISDYWLEDNAFARNPHMLLSLVANATKHVRIGTTTPITIRPPAVIARDMMTLEEIAPGRVAVAIGLGTEKSTKVLKNGIETIKSVFNGQEIRYYGRSVNVRNLKIDWPPRRKIPIYAAVNGLKNCEVAAEVADGIHFAVMSADYVGHVVEKTKKTRSLKDFDFINHIVTFVSEDYDKAEALAKSYVRPHFVPIPYVYKISGFTDKEIETLKNWPREALRAEEIVNKLMTKSATERKGVPEEIVNKLAAKFSLFGTPDDIVKQLKEYEKKGLNLMCLTIFGPEISSDITLLAKEVFPEFTD
jgi:alkanesulfonate monooxygenase SsuD/methylene tetrahydromethanopterin reductase-like flavin-dependent oxidoreductase (luciferase family)